MLPEASQERAPALSDGEVVARVRAGERGLYELLLRRHNRTVYRAIRSLLRDEAEVEDAMQQVYLTAFSRLGQFGGTSRFSTWLVAIALNEARARIRRRLRRARLDFAVQAAATPAGAPDPERAAQAREAAALLERAVDALPPGLRMAFVLREVEGLDAAATAAALGVSTDVVKTRVHRARLRLRAVLAEAPERAAAGAFAFEAPRCDRVVAGVLARLGAAAPDPAAPR